VEEEGMVRDRGGCGRSIAAPSMKTRF